MKRLLASAATALFLVAGTGSVGTAQTPSLFDLGLYGGVQYTSDWFKVGDDGYKTGFGPIFGAQATFWATPMIGVRVHGSYFPTGLPEFDDNSISESSYPVNNYFADLNLAVRPFLNSTGRMMQSMYLFLGGGAAWANVAGDPNEDAIDCVAGYPDVCVSYDPSYATVGQGNVGIGFDWASLTETIGIFTELAVHGYDSPAHVGASGNVEDKFTFTPPATRPIDVCVVQNGALSNVSATFNPATGDTTVTGRPFRTAYPSTSPNYAANESWFIQSDSLTFSNQQYVKFGVARTTTISELTPAGTVNGITVFNNTTETAPFTYIYVPIRPGCEFQPYQQRTIIRPRG